MTTDTGADAGTETDTYEVRVTSTPRGACLARRLAARRVREWGHPGGSEAHDAVCLVVAELTANAVTHGRVPGRDVLLRLVREPERLRVEVSDTRGEHLPHVRGADVPVDAETGRGLLLVAALAEEWGVDPCRGGPGKTVWAVVARRHPR